MKLDIGPFRLSMSRAGNPAAKPAALLDAEALHGFNDATLAAVRDLPRAELNSRLARISIPQLVTEQDRARAQQILSREGIVIVPGYLDAASLQAPLEAISARLEAVDDVIALGETCEEPDLLVQGYEVRLNSYAALAEYDRPVVTVRQGADAGMVDVFNVDRLAGEGASDVRAPFENTQLLKLLQHHGEGLTPANLNMYLNRGITATRGFHVDNFETNLKGFVYLSNVSSLNSGPYCYVTGSHRDDAWRQANRAISTHCAAPTEAPLVDPGRVVPVLAPAGSLVISDQSGVHRGMPQAPDAERRVLVMRYN
jgi:hypothetical protein